MKLDIGELTQKLGDWLRPPAPGPAPSPVSVARAMLERDRLSSLLSYRDFDTENNLLFLDDGETPACGFMLVYYPLLLAGTDAEPQIEAVINACPPGAVLQFSALSSPYVEPTLNLWTQARLKNNQHPLLHQSALRRRDFMLATSMAYSMLPTARMHPRSIQYFLSVRIPFTGNPAEPTELRAWRHSVLDLRDAIQGALLGTGISSSPLDENQVRFVLRELLNPQLEPSERPGLASPDVPLQHDIVDRETRVRVCADGNLGFSRAPAESGEEQTVKNEVRVIPITVDTYPEEAYLPMTASLIGDPLSREDRITAPFWVYTTIHVLDADRARERLTTKLGTLNKQAMSDSDWYKSMMSHLFDRRRDVDGLLQRTRQGHQMVRCYSGINLYSDMDNAKKDTEYVRAVWRRAGFRASPEPFISLPVFLASLPMQYTPSMDPPNRGMQRAVTMHSLNAASFAHVQGDWSGNHPAEGGPLLISRRGQLTSFNLLNTVSNYNFIIVAASGSGKSYLCNEIVSDFLSKKGLVRIIDVGRSYERFCSIMGGTNMVFDPQDPISLNPFWGINDERDLAEMLPMLKALLRQMAYPLQLESDTPPWEYQLIETAVVEAWTLHQGETELRHVYDWLKEHSDQRAQDLGDQLQSYAIGRYAPWFSGPRQLSFDNDMVVVELEELNADNELKTVVLTLCIHQITKEMYLSGRERPKLLAIDEAWDLLGNVKTGKFIETAFRRARKYNGIAGVITQSFEDFEKSPAARAAIENAAWQFVLYQKPESLEFAAANKRVVANEHLMNLLRTVKSGEGFSEVYVRSEVGQGVYRFVVDRHSHYTFTTNANDINRIDALVAGGKTLVEAIDELATADYRTWWSNVK